MAELAGQDAPIQAFSLVPKGKRGMNCAAGAPAGVIWAMRSLGPSQLLNRIRGKSSEVVARAGQRVGTGFSPR
jgi:hypothetical protein